MAKSLHALQLLCKDKFIYPPEFDLFRAIPPWKRHSIGVGNGFNIFLTYEGSSSAVVGSNTAALLQHPERTTNVRRCEGV